MEKCVQTCKYNDLKVNIEERLDRIPNVGVSMAETIKNAKNSLKHLFVPGMFFEEMGIVYVGPGSMDTMSKVF